jgi:hypothetical protein
MGPFKSEKISVNEKNDVPFRDGPFVDVGERIDYFDLFLPFSYILAVDSKYRLCLHRLF